MCRQGAFPAKTGATDRSFPLDGKYPHLWLPIKTTQPSPSDAWRVWGLGFRTCRGPEGPLWKCQKHSATSHINHSERYSPSGQNMANQRPEPDKDPKFRLECINFLIKSHKAHGQDCHEADADQFQLPEEGQDLRPSGGHTGK